MEWYPTSSLWLKGLIHKAVDFVGVCVRNPTSSLWYDNLVPQWSGVGKDWGMRRPEISELGVTIGLEVGRDVLRKGRCLLGTERATRERWDSNSVVLHIYPAGCSRRGDPVYSVRRPMQ